MKKETFEEASKIYEKIAQCEKILNLHEAQADRHFAIVYLKDRSQEIPIELEEEILALINKWKRKFEKQLKQL